MTRFAGTRTSARLCCNKDHIHRFCQTWKELQLIPLLGTSSSLCQPLLNIPLISCICHCILTSLSYLQYRHPHFLRQFLNPGVRLIQFLTDPSFKKLLHLIRKLINQFLMITGLEVGWDSFLSYVWRHHFAFICINWIPIWMKRWLPEKNLKERNHSIFRIFWQNSCSCTQYVPVVRAVSSCSTYLGTDRVSFLRNRRYRWFSVSLFFYNLNLHRWKFLIFSMK